MIAAIFAAGLYIPGIIPMPHPYYEYAPIGGQPGPAVYADPRFQEALSACGAPPPGYGLIFAPANPAVRCMDVHGYILVENFHAPRE